MSRETYRYFPYPLLYTGIPLQVSADCWNLPLNDDSSPFTPTTTSCGSVIACELEDSLLDGSGSDDSDSDSDDSDSDELLDDDGGSDDSDELDGSDDSDDDEGSSEDDSEELSCSDGSSDEDSDSSDGSEDSDDSDEFGASVSVIWTSIDS